MKDYTLSTKIDHFYLICFCDTLWGLLNTLKNFQKNFNHIFEDKLIFKWKPTHSFLFGFYISILIF